MRFAEDSYISRAGDGTNGVRYSIQSLNCSMIIEKRPLLYFINQMLIADRL